MWKATRLVGDNVWIMEVIERGTLITVTDGSYMQELMPHLCSAAFILECSEENGMSVEDFTGPSSVAKAYTGELLGLMANHLILLSVNELWPRLFLDNLLALGKVTDLPPHRIPTQCKHSDVLKNIIVDCTDMSFSVQYLHIPAH